ncbi:probable RNA-binding protein EIF1AD [Cuculus canorus]|uniref:probable RNA-binding protein EIF1AD n=1 Tax=Cuculus canorus TaxID=55661 RepID=UPI0023AA2D85|nr:probable RNA-binding protein EIF1AD [Cuculus canorus]XP_053908513.1 probable RNA-binding protein EIF1AD [Cuculus canorus]
MSRATKRKHVVRELLEEHVTPGPGQSVVRVLGTPGNNLHAVETAEGGRFLASMPPRFRRHVWIKRGDFVLVDPIAEGAKVKAEISLVLLPRHIRGLQRRGLWPEAFALPERPKTPESRNGDEDLFVNTNRGGDTRDSDEDTRDEEDTCDDEDTGDEEDDTCDDESDAEAERDTRDDGDAAVPK